MTLASLEKHPFINLLHNLQSCSQLKFGFLCEMILLLSLDDNNKHLPYPTHIYLLSSTKS